MLIGLSRTRPPRRGHPSGGAQLGFDPAALARIDASVGRGIEQRQMASAVTLIARPATIALMKADQIPAEIDGALPPTDGAKRNGFTFGYQIKRRDGGPDPLPAGTLRWGGATGPRFCINPADGLVAIFLTRLPSGTPLEPRNAFYPLVMESRGRRPGG